MNTNKPRKETISVIVPVYKVEAYITQCLESLLHQTYGNLEIILIDDGSPDRCGKICDDYAERDSRIRVLHKQNAGVHAAWNDGLRAATGEWIAFVDPDDWVELDYFEQMISDANTKKADVVLTSGFYGEEETRRYVWRTYLSSFFYENGSGRDRLVEQTLVRSNDKRVKAKVSGVWGKLYRASFLQNGKFQFDETIRVGLPGDALFNVDVYINASNVSGILYYGYHYRINTSSGTFKYDPNRPQNMAYAFRQFEAKLQGLPSAEKMQKALDSYALRDIAQNLQRACCHPENKSTRREKVSEIKKMKQMPCYHRAIWSGNNPYNGFALTIFQRALRLPFVWSLRMMVVMWNYIDKREKKVA